LVGSVKIVAYPASVATPGMSFGGYSKMSVLGLNELEIIQSTGSPAYKDPITRSTRTPARARKRC